jgi:hypothetical protein
MTAGFGRIIRYVRLRVARFASSSSRRPFGKARNAFHPPVNWKSRIVRLALLGLTIVFCFHEGRAQTSTEPYATKHFLDAPPATADLSKLPATARDVIVAKVRIVEGLHYLVARDQSGKFPPLPRDLFMALVEIVEVRVGKAATRQRYDVYFGVPGIGTRIKYPHTPSQKTRDYFIVSHLDKDNKRRLIGFPVGEKEYEQWEMDVSEHERMRGRPGGPR